MITLTPAAAKQVRTSAEQTNAENLALRVAARKNPDGTMQYGIGFDEVKEEDLLFDCEGIQVVMSPENGPLLKGTTIDYVELEPGQFSLIVMNPNDANYTPPGEEGGCGGGGCGSGGCG